MNRSSQGFILYSLAIVVTAIILVTIPFMGMAEEEEGKDFRYKGVIERVEKGLEPGTAGEPVRFMYDQEGSQMLLWGYEHRNDLRILGNDLTTKGILVLPYEDFIVSGATLAYSGRWVFAWGRTPFNDTDLLVAYNLTDHRLDREHIPEGTVPLTEIDDVNLMGEGLILVVTGRDGNGTNRVVFIETAKMTELKNDTIPDNRAVISIDHDGVMMILVMDDGGILVYSTNYWTLEVQFQVFNGPFTSFEIKETTDWHFANADGEVVGMTYYDNYSFLNLTTPNGPIRAIYSVEYFGHMVTSIPDDSSSTELDVWKMEIKGWKMQSSIIIDGTVTSFVEDPAHNNTFAVGLSDGSIELYQVVVIKDPIPPREPTWGDKYGKITGTMGILAIILLIVVVLKIRGKPGDG